MVPVSLNLLDPLQHAAAPWSPEGLDDIDVSPSLVQKDDL